MTRDEKIIRNKVGVLELAKQLGSVNQADPYATHQNAGGLASGYD